MCNGQLWNFQLLICQLCNCQMYNCYLCGFQLFNCHLCSINCATVNFEMVNCTFPPHLPPSPVVSRHYKDLWAWSLSTITGFTLCLSHWLMGTKLASGRVEEWSTQWVGALTRYLASSVAIGRSAGHGLGPLPTGFGSMLMLITNTQTHRETRETRETRRDTIRETIWETEGQCPAPGSRQSLWFFHRRPNRIQLPFKYWIPGELQEVFILVHHSAFQLVFNTVGYLGVHLIWQVMKPNVHTKNSKFFNKSAPRVNLFSKLTSPYFLWWIMSLSPLESLITHKRLEMQILVIKLTILDNFRWV